MAAPPVAGSAYSHAETIQKLERLNQLETMTAEQRIRIEKYRTMYETLKAEQEQSDEDKRRRENELHMIRDEIKCVQNRCQELVSQARQERDQKIDECEELRMKVLTPQKMEVMKIKMAEEIETPYKTKMEGLEQEVDRYRNEFNRLRYDYSFLKSEYEHELTQKKTFVDELNGKAELEKETLRKEIASLREELENAEPADVQRLRSLQKENAQLTLRVKGLHAELEEMREKKETINSQIDQQNRLQARQISELNVRCKSLETEKETSKLQYERLQKEVEKLTREQDNTSNDLQKSERENLQLKSQVEEITHSKKMELNAVKVSLMKDRGDLERERDTLRMEVNMVKNKYTVQENNLQDLKTKLEEKERDAIKRVQTIKEEEWSKLNKVESVKSQLESQISSLEQQQINLHQSYKSQLEQMDENLKAEKDYKEKYERDVANMKLMLTQERQKNKTISQENEKLSDVKSRYQKLLQDHESTISSEHDLKNNVEKYIHNIELLKRELETQQNDIRMERETHQKHTQDVCKRHEEDKDKHHDLLKNIQNEHKDLKKKYEKLTATCKKKIKRLKTELQTSKEQLQILQSKEDQHELEKQALRKNLSLEQERMRRKMQKFRHRQQQFGHVLNTSNFNVMGGLEGSPNKHTSSFKFPPNEFGGGGAPLPPRSTISPITDFQDENESPNDG
ncbi:centrosomal protein of 83 kDa-like [Clytia hemisphaerica]|uniref:Uncharacterized protein n=1 Tax=Clytia hemisphaerica TaxID=252671 RepID=A0A7M5XG56_9CNID